MNLWSLIFTDVESHCFIPSETHNLIFTSLLCGLGIAVCNYDPTVLRRESSATAMSIFSLSWQSSCAWGFCQSTFQFLLSVSVQYLHLPNESLSEILHTSPRTKSLSKSLLAAALGGYERPWCGNSVPLAVWVFILSFLVWHYNRNIAHCKRATWASQAQWVPLQLLPQTTHSLLLQFLLMWVVDPCME